MNTSCAIVGTAGRKDDIRRLSKPHFEAMCKCANLLLEELDNSNYGVNQLVSGGAAWADHVAVKLFLQKRVPHLKLCFPCHFLFKEGIFDPTPTTDSERQRGYSNGETLNRLHGQFSRTASLTSLDEINLAIGMGAEYVVAKGFYARNAIVAQADVILAMTFGEKEWLKEGGTAHTVQTYLNRVRKLGFFDKSFHYDLNSGDLFAGAKVKNS